ncbi:VRR-NUC domain-containing protein [Burkholderia cenocepacia]|uniref:VRR-NUC domain-containing protein n=1 Tax=Burkholderia cenocepacia TaxID=95486 RepID=UPI001BA2F073|nr:VRR-NUC domain-containing protein [Burkholderia cenocepacia]MBR8070404.1 VRR-NUC domain-containing protein [Burkholderia cenocepacia]
MRESDIENYLVARVKALGGEVRKVKWIGRRGAPDRIVMLPARGGCRAPLTVWVELKAPGVPPEAHQVREHERMRAAGQYVEVVDSFSRVDEVLA